MKRNSKYRKWLISGAVFISCFVLSFTLLSLNAFKTDIAKAASVESTTNSIHYGDGSVYEGESIEGSIRNGTGKYTWATGETYDGIWVSGNMTGTGEMTWPGLGTYKGDFVNNKRQGKGVFIWTYEGEPDPGDPVSYDGEWDNDKIGSNGTLVIAGFGIYSGAFLKQKRAGFGKFTWNNGDVYEGNWTADNITGDGILTISDGTLLEGKFQNGKLTSGTMTYQVEDGTAVRKVMGGKAQTDVKVKYSDGTILEGKTKGKTFTGNVTITYSGGDKYVGTIKAGLKDGKGTYTWRNGAHYVGEWSGDYMHGTGKYYYNKSEKDTYLTGNFANGKPSGTLIYVAENKLKYQTVWKNGQCTSITYKR